VLEYVYILLTIVFVNEKMTLVEYYVEYYKIKNTIKSLTFLSIYDNSILFVYILFYSILFVFIKNTIKSLTFLSIYDNSIS
jgi:hypothetical protein